MAVLLSEKESLVATRWSLCRSHVLLLISVLLKKILNLKANAQKQKLEGKNALPARNLISFIQHYPITLES